MKRTRNRWTRFSLLCLFIITQLPTSSAVKATSLIFSKTTSTTAAPEEVSEVADDGVMPETPEEETKNSTKYTGIPQIDYLLDPNLPRELNGYNLSEYPFYETVPPPETMNFKCDGLHDGFYASIQHKCQVYHHCLFGTRYDFLCANYTAFDQKTFICQFVSEVDCKNSAKYFSRNEALYKATTAAPPPPPPSTTTTTTPRPPPPRPGRRRPYYRQDYYDDDYYQEDYDFEERGGRGRPRGRPSSRPGNRRPYNYDDDRYESRPRGRDEDEEEFEERRPYEDRRRPAKRPDRRPYDEEDRRPSYRGGKRPRPRDEEERYRPRDSFRPKDDKIPINETRFDDDRRESRPRDDEDRRDSRPRDETPRDSIRPRDETPRDIRPRDETPRDSIRTRDETPRERPRDITLPLRSRDDPNTMRPRDENRDSIRPRDEPRDTMRPKDEDRDKFRPRNKDDDMMISKPRVKDSNVDDERKDGFRPRDRTRDERRPAVRDDDRYERRQPERPYRNRDTKNDRYKDREEEKEEKKPDVPLVKPNGHGIFGQPRMPPPIKRPVPAKERQKYDYVPIATTKAPPPKEDEYYDYEEDDVSRTSSSGKTSTVQRPKPEPIEKEKFKPSRSQFSSAGSFKPKKIAKPVEYDDEDDYYYETVPKTRPTRVDDRSKDDYYEDEVRDKERDYKRGEGVTSKIKDVKPNVRVVKRPFLPSRGGSPYLPRGLQPIAGRNMSVAPSTTPKPTTTTTTTTTTTPEPTTTQQQTTTYVTTEKPATEQQNTEEYEYYDEEDTEYDQKHKELTTIENEPETTVENEPKTTIKTEEEKQITTEKPEEDYEPTYKPTTTVSTTTQMTAEQRAKNLASKVLKTYNDQYEAVKKQLQTTLNPGDYANAFLSHPVPKHRPYHYKPEEFIPMETEDQSLKKPKYQEEYTPEVKEKPKLKPIPDDFKPSEEIPPDFKPKVKQFKALPKVQPKPEISKPYTATSKPYIPENISIKANLADGDADYDVRYNEAISPVPVTIRAPQAFIAPNDYVYSRFRSNLPEQQYAASELQSYQLRKRPQISGVSIRTPTSFYLQPQRYDDGIQRYPRQILYRLGDFF